MNFLFEKCSSFNLGFVLTTTTVSHSYSVNDRKPSGAKYKEMDYCKQSFKSLCVNVRVLCMHLDLPKRQKLKESWQAEGLACELTPQKLNGGPLLS